MLNYIGVIDILITTEDDEDEVSISVLGEEEGVGFGLILHNPVVLEILK